MDEVAEDLKAVTLLNWLFFKQFCDCRDAVTQLLELGVTVCNLELSFLDLKTHLALELLILVDF